MRTLGSCLLVLATCSLVLAGCGSGGDSACDLLTDDEAEEILGVPTGSGVEDDESLGPESTCSWVSEDSSTADEGEQVYGLAITLQDGDEAIAEFEDRQESSRESKAEDVDGLGDDAYFVIDTEENSLPPPKFSLPYLRVRVGDQVVTFDVHDTDERPVKNAEAREFLLEMADRAVPRVS